MISLLSPMSSGERGESSTDIWSCLGASAAKGKYGFYAGFILKKV